MWIIISVQQSGLWMYAFGALRPSKWSVAGTYVHGCVLKSGHGLCRLRHPQALLLPNAGQPKVFAAPTHTARLLCTFRCLPMAFFCLQDRPILTYSISNALRSRACTFRPRLGGRFLFAGDWLPQHQHYQD